MLSRTHEHIHAGAHVLLTLSVMDDEGPVPGIDEPGTDGQDDLQPGESAFAQRSVLSLVPGVVVLHALVLRVMETTFSSRFRLFYRSTLELE